MSYDINQCQLYKLRNKKRLAEIFNFKSFFDFKKYVVNKCYYIKFDKIIRGKKRTIDHPNLSLSIIHSRIFELLRRITPPDYLHSGVKGRSYISNAEAHIGPFPVCTLDIKSFYPSTTFTRVYNCYHKVFLCSPDVSFFLTKVSTNGEFLPTGSQLSQILAFYCHKEIFDTIYNNSIKDNFTMTCYVDDITISGNGLNKKWIYDNVKKVIKSKGLEYHKEKFYLKFEHKLITGVIVNDEKTKLRNKHHLNIYSSFQELSDETMTGRDKVYEKIVGQLSAAGQIEKKFITLKEHLKPPQI